MKTKKKTHKLPSSFFGINTHTVYTYALGCGHAPVTCLSVSEFGESWQNLILKEVAQHCIQFWPMVAKLVVCWGLFTLSETMCLFYFREVYWNGWLYCTCTSMCSLVCVCTAYVVYCSNPSTKCAIRSLVKTQRRSSLTLTPNRATFLWSRTSGKALTFYTGYDSQFSNVDTAWHQIYLLILLF